MTTAHPMKRSLLFLFTMNLFSLFALGSTPAPLVPGAPAPQLTAKDQDGKAISFADVYSKGITLVYFYPKAETPGCTAEACSLRDAYEGLHAKGLQILGVSKDGVEAQKKFHENKKLPFTLIADPEGNVSPFSSRMGKLSGPPLVPRPEVPRKKSKKPSIPCRNRTDPRSGLHETGMNLAIDFMI